MHIHSHYRYTVHISFVGIAQTHPPHHSWRQALVSQIDHPVPSQILSSLYQLDRKGSHLDPSASPEWAWGNTCPWVVCAPVWGCCLGTRMCMKTQHPPYVACIHLCVMNIDVYSQCLYILAKDDMFCTQYRALVQNKSVMWVECRVFLLIYIGTWDFGDSSVLR